MNDELTAKSCRFSEAVQGSTLRNRLQPPSPRYGLPCANCRRYYSADLTACPLCNFTQRIEPTDAWVRSPNPKRA